MNIQIFGTKKCFETKKAERYFKERRIKYQFVDIVKFGMSQGEFRSVKTALKLKCNDLVDESKLTDSTLLFKYLGSEQEKEDFILEHQEIIKTPIVRDGKKATLGCCPEIWKSWEG